MIKLHYNLARTMDECMAKLQKNKEAEMSIQEKMASTIPIVQNRSSQTYEFLASLWRGGVTDL